MASFDIIESTSKAFRFVWEERPRVLQLSMMVLTVKIVAFVAFVVFGIQQDILRQGLLSIPVYLLEGWVIAQLMVVALYAFAKASKDNGSVLPPAEDIERNTKASMIVYVLIKLALSFVVGSSYEGQITASANPNPDPSGQMFILAVMILIFVIWSFRFFWLYVPIVMGRHPMAFLSRFKAFSASFYLIGTWVLCFVPMLLLMLILSEIFGVVSSVMGITPESVVYKSGLAAIQAVIDYAASLLSSLAIAFGIYSVFKGENKKTEIW